MGAVLQTQHQPPCPCELLESINHTNMCKAQNFIAGNLVHRISMGAVLANQSSSCPASEGIDSSHQS